MKKIIFFLSAFLFIISCQDDDYEIPKDAGGNAILTDVSSATTDGVSILDNSFSVKAYLPNAVSGDVMTVECLQQQPYNGGSDQLLPLAGSQKTVTVGSDLTASVSYDKSEVNMTDVGDYVTVSFAGETEYALQKVSLVNALEITSPMVGDMEVEISRSNETAYFNVTVDPKSSGYTGTLVVQRKNGMAESWMDVSGSPFSSLTDPFTAMVPIKGTDFAAGMDTMYYSFSASMNGYTDYIEKKLIVRDPYFYLKKSAEVAVNSGLNLLINETLAEDDVKSMLTFTGTLIEGGSAWLNAGNTIKFVPTTSDMYTLNNSNTAIAAFESGVSTVSADPIMGEGIYIFKAITGTDPEDVYYGMIKVISVIPNSSVTIEYRIGNMYAHLSVIE